MWLWKTQSRSNKNTRPLHCYWFSCDKHNLQKRESHSQGCATQVDCILVWGVDLKPVMDAKVKDVKVKNTSHIAVFKIQTFTEMSHIAAKQRANFCAEDNTEGTWKNLEQCLLTGVDNGFGKTKGG